MVLMRGNYEQLTAHETIIDKIESSLASRMSEIDFDRIFDVKDTTKRRQTVKLTHGISGVQRVAENQDYPEATGEEGNSISYVQQKYGADIVVTEETDIYDEYDVLGDEIDSLMDELLAKMQEAHYDVFNNGQSTSYTDTFGDTVSAVGPDGLALFSTVHHKHTGLGAAGGVFSNIINDGTYDNAELSFTALDKIRQLGKLFKDSHLVNRPVKFNELLVGPDLETLAHRIIDSDKLQGTGNNDVNPLKGRFDIMTSEYIDTGNWFVMDKIMKKKTFKSFFRTRPMVKPPKEYEPNDTNHYRVKARWAHGFAYAPYVVGSDSSKS